MTAEEQANIDWGLTTWKGSRLQQHREFYRLPLRRKLEIIEGFGELARVFQEQRKRKNLPYISIETGERVCGAPGYGDPPTSPKTGLY
ncbi:MAG: hypothetical protein ACREFF_03700 [Candidatus Udaeobacter sp.]